ncbi:MAG TPA: helix-turn-helix transcriptional regulator [Bacillota bacterium]|nr:helix-turn-helix transcriptional regulator [Bacillota bacterium]HQA48219.1 helix-turn-helix transcriptional regulator [Bacillota bacterium]
MSYRVDYEKIARLRKLKGYTQETMAAELGVSRSFYSQKEIGAKRFRAEELLILAKLLGEDLEGLFKSEGGRDGG